MSLSDCPQCWSTPCECGYNYRHWSDERFAKFVNSIDRGRLRYLEEDRLAKEEKSGIKLLKTIFFTDPETSKPAEIFHVDTTANGFIVFTKSGKNKWKHTITTEEM